MSENTQSVGNLNEEETTAIARHRQLASELLNQVGQLEVRKARLLALIERNEAGAQKVLSEVATRLEIAEGATWQVQADGSVVVTTTSEDTPAEEG